MPGPLNTGKNCHSLVSQGRSVPGADYTLDSKKQAPATCLHAKGGIQISSGQRLLPDEIQHLLAWGGNINQWQIEAQDWEPIFPWEHGRGRYQLSPGFVR